MSLPYQDSFPVAIVHGNNTLHVWWRLNISSLLLDLGTINSIYSRGSFVLIQLELLWWINFVYQTELTYCENLLYFHSITVTYRYVENPKLSTLQKISCNNKKNIISNSAHQMNYVIIFIGDYVQSWIIKNSIYFCPVFCRVRLQTWCITT